MTVHRSEYPSHPQGLPGASADVGRLKIANEEIQRNTRKLRAEGRLPAHEARWFDSNTDPDSGERVWTPKRAENGEVLFWHRRENAPATMWNDVDHIFAEDQR